MKTYQNMETAVVAIDRNQALEMLSFHDGIDTGKFRLGAIVQQDVDSVMLKSLKLSDIVLVDVSEGCERSVHTSLRHNRLEKSGYASLDLQAMRTLVAESAVPGSWKAHRVIVVEGTVINNGTCNLVTTFSWHEGQGWLDGLSSEVMDWDADAVFACFKKGKEE